MFKKYISSEATDDLMHYLISHESDIALDINDFGELRAIFTELLDHEPKEDSYGV